MAHNCVVASQPCGHCKGTGQCYCRTCASPSDVGACGDDVDTGRQDEGTCQICGGQGKVDQKGQTLEA